ncbi:hypothetical protein J2Z81_002863 [Virgibacillus campisalis]|uniref:Transposase n=1 Tax=Virgibacillus alimentarius TaxID=698769 RepID=A0ABS4SD01_9BACI|nr:hypothetical protein [Virgibacillus alimentarius]
MVKPKRNPNSEELAYQPESVEDMQNALKEIFGPMFESMLKEEINTHLGYQSNKKRKNNWKQKERLRTKDC